MAMGGCGGECQQTTRAKRARGNTRIQEYWFHNEHARYETRRAKLLRTSINLNTQLFYTFLSPFTRPVTVGRDNLSPSQNENSAATLRRHQTTRKLPQGSTGQSPVATHARGQAAGTQLTRSVPEWRTCWFPTWFPTGPEVPRQHYAVPYQRTRPHGSCARSGRSSGKIPCQRTRPAGHRVRPQGNRKPRLDLPIAQCGRMRRVAREASTYAQRTTHHECPSAGGTR